jgi:MFS family permease
MALALLIVGNGFFKPNISTMVGRSTPRAPAKRDGGFTLFYMGINLGAAMAPLLCGYVGETYGWHYGFGLATIGMLIGLAVFVAPRVLTQILILAGSVAAAGMMVWAGWEDKIMLGVNAPVALALLVAAGIAAMAVGQGACPTTWAARKTETPRPRRGRGPAPPLVTTSPLFKPTAMVWAPCRAGAAFKWLQDGPPRRCYVLHGTVALAMLTSLFEDFRSDKIGSASASGRSC